MSVGISRALMPFVLTCGLMGLYAADRDAATVVRGAVADMATRCLDEGQPSADQTLLDFARTNGISRDALCGVLLEIASEKTDTDGQVETTDFSLWALAKYGYEAAIPILQRKLDEATASGDGTRRRACIIGIMMIGGKESLEVAERILKDSRSSKMDKYYVFEHLGNHLASARDSKDREFTDNIGRIFLGTIDAYSTDSDIVALIDRALAAYSTDYRTGQQRREILRKHEQCANEHLRKYFQETLSTLDKERRTTRTHPTGGCGGCMWVGEASQRIRHP